MIITVTLNPALDRTIELQSLKKGTLNYIEKSMSNIGGKGINVSLTLAALEIQSLATGFAGGEGRNEILQCLKGKNIRTHFCDTGSEVRTNVKIMEEDGTLTELNEAGPQIEEQSLEKFVRDYGTRVEKGDLVVLSGSVPGGVPEDIYGRLIRIAHRKGAKVILDADGPLFAQGVEAVPDIIKPNEEELFRYGNRIFPDREKNLLEVAETLLKKGIPTVLVSMGKKGAYFFSHCSEEYYYSPAPEVPVRSSVGAGDSFVAAWSAATERGMSAKEAARYSMAVSAAAVMTAGTTPPEKKEIKELLSKVKIETRKW